MANLDETGAAGYDWEQDGIYQLEITDRVQGGAGGIANRQASELAERTRNLHDRLLSAETNKADLNSPVLIGTPTAPTADAETNSTQIATTAFVKAAIALLLNSAPEALDTLNELAIALGNDPDFAATITNELALKAPKASPALTGTPTAPTAAVATNNTQIATTAFVKAVVAALVDSSPGTLDTLNELAAALGDDPNFATSIANELALKAPKTSPALDGTPTAPTADSGNNTTQLATTAFVQAAIAAISNEDLENAFATALALKLNKTFDNIEDQAQALAALGLSDAIIGSVTYDDVSEALKGAITDDDGTWDFSAAGIINAAFTADTTLVLNNLQVNKILKVKLTTTNSPVITLPDYVVPFDGNADPTENGTFYLYFECWNAIEGSEDVTLTIIQRPA